MIVGTAGHIDHGKTALVRALTGVDTDRLKEEKARGISIDLGFAYLPVEKGTIGFVDVPGHERFIRNMLAGVSGIDFALLVIAANEGIKPQTEEHLQILDLLGISRGVVALTKIDLAGNERRNTLLKEIAERLQSTSLNAASIVPVSSTTGQGIDALRRVILDAHKSRAVSRGEGQFRMPVDRCFTLNGIGTVVTGTVTGGQVAIGDQVVISPSGIEAQVRSIHAQSNNVDVGRRGARCALNLVGTHVSRDAISRGDVVGGPALHLPTDRIDTYFRLLKSERNQLSHWTPVKLLHGTTEVVARVVILSDGSLPPGKEGFVQLVLDRPTAAVVGERFVVRDISDQRTIGGGRFIDLRAPTHRRRSPRRIAQLQGHLNESSSSALKSLLLVWPYYVPLMAFGRDRALTTSQVDELVRDSDLVVLVHDKERLALSREIADALKVNILSILDDYHRTHAELMGIGFERLRIGLDIRLPVPALNQFLQGLVTAKSVVVEGAWIRLTSHVMHLNITDERLWQKILPFLIGAERFRPPKVRDIAERVASTEYDIRRLLKTLAKMNKVREVSLDHFFASGVVSEIFDILIDLASNNSGRVTVADLRDRLDNGRKVAIELLEFFDRHGVTIRRGDFRILNQPKLGLFKTGTPKLAEVR